jgi:hypothetical protein
MVGCFSCGSSFRSREGEAAGFLKVKEKALKEVSNWGIFFLFWNKVQSSKMAHCLWVGQVVVKAGGSPPENGLGGTSSLWLLLIPVIDFEETEAERVDEEKGDRRQDFTTDGLEREIPRWGKSMVKSSRDWGAEGKAPVSAGRSPFEGVNCTKWCIRKVLFV